MTIVVEPLRARPRREDAMAALFADGWPAWIIADREVPRHLPRVRAAFADLELVLIDTGDVAVAAGWAVTLRWDGDPERLPAGYTGSLARAVADLDAGATPDTLVVMAAQVHPERRGEGLAGELLTAMRALAADRGLPRVVAPVRPTSKARYPLTPVDTFARWTRDDGAPLDPWLRTHHRLGARIVATSPASQTMTGTVGEWEAWTGLALPSSGDYVIPGGLAVLRVDRDAGEGVYVEPGVWVRHA